MKTWATPNGVKVTRLLMGRSNIFLVSNDRFTMAVDTSIGFERRMALGRVRKALEGRKLDALLLTHTHFDHAGNTAAYRRTFGCSVMVHESEADFLKAGYSPVPDGSVPVTRILNRLDKHKIKFLVRTEPAVPDILIGSELDLNPEGIPVRIIHTPGHSCGSVAAVVDESIVITGDSIVHVFSRKIFPPFCDDVPALLKSWEALLATSCNLFLPSHGREVTRELFESSFLARTGKQKDDRDR